APAPLRLSDSTGEAEPVSLLLGGNPQRMAQMPRGKQVARRLHHPVELRLRKRHIIVINRHDPESALEEFSKELGRTHWIIGEMMTRLRMPPKLHGVFNLVPGRLGGRHDPPPLPHCLSGQRPASPDSRAARRASRNALHSTLSAYNSTNTPGRSSNIPASTH